MLARDFIRSSLLTKDRKFIGRVSFPAGSFAAARNEIMAWVLLREQENSRMLGLDAPRELSLSEKDRDAAGCVSSETPIGSLIEFAVSKSGDAAFRYFHHMIAKGTAPARNKISEREGFLTSFVFQRSASVPGTIDLWMRLEYCYSSLVRPRRIDPTVPRIFKLVVERAPGAKSEVHSGSTREAIENASKTMPSYDEIERRVRSEHRSDARKKTDEPVDVKPRQSEIFSFDFSGRVTGINIAGEAKGPVDREVTGLKGWLAKLHDAIVGLHELGENFFNPDYKVGPVDVEPQEAPAEPVPPVSDPAKPEPKPDPVPAVPGDLRIDFQSMPGVVAVMDLFEERLPDGNPRYARLILERFASVGVSSRKTCWANLIIERSASVLRTRTAVRVWRAMQFKMIRVEARTLTKRILEALKKRYRGTKLPAPPWELSFSRPIQLNADVHCRIIQEKQISNAVRKSTADMKQNQEYFIVGVRIENS